MTLTGPQKIPFAVTSGSSWYQDTYLGDAMEVNVGVIHTTEGTSLPSYGGGGSAPNVTGFPDFASQTIKWYQHFDVDRSSRALVNKAGGVQTNTLNCFQIELVGTCDSATHNRWTMNNVKHIFWPEAPDWALAGVAKLVRWLHDNHGIKIQSTVTWKAYPSSYGANGVRLSGSQWLNYYGWLGHQHVPENDHGDPGNINWKRIEELAKGAAPGGDTNVALTTEQDTRLKNVESLVKSLWDNRKVAPWQYKNTSIDDRDAYAVVRDTERQVKELAAKVDSMAFAGVDLDALAAKVADLLAARLAN